MAMHTYRFSEFQAGLVESGEKTMTIRAPRKAPTRVGDTLRLTGPVFAGFEGGGQSRAAAAHRGVPRRPSD